MGDETGEGAKPVSVVEAVEPSGSKIGQIAKSVAARGCYVYTDSGFTTIDADESRPVLCSPKENTPVGMIFKRTADQDFSSSFTGLGFFVSLPVKDDFVATPKPEQKDFTREKWAEIQAGQRGYKRMTEDLDKEGGARLVILRFPVSSHRTGGCIFVNFSCLLPEVQGKELERIIRDNPLSVHEFFNQVFVQESGDIAQHASANKTDYQKHLKKLAIVTEETQIEKRRRDEHLNTLAALYELSRQALSVSLSA